MKKLKSVTLLLIVLILSVGCNPQYQVQITVLPDGGGTVTGGGDYPRLTEVTVEAEAQAGYDFAGWYENDILLTPHQTHQFVITRDRALEARFNRLE